MDGKKILNEKIQLKAFKPTALNATIGALEIVGIDYETNFIIDDYICEVGDCEKGDGQWYYFVNGEADKDFINKALPTEISDKDRIEWYILTYEELKEKIEDD